MEFNNRFASSVWCFTHYLINLSQKSGFVEGVRLEDQKVSLQNLLEKFRDDFTLIGASGNLFFFSPKDGIILVLWVLISM